MSRTELIEMMRPMPTEEKRAFVEQVWEEFGDELGWIDPGLTPELIAEFERRGEAVVRNPQSGIPWEQVRAELKERIKGRSCLAK